MAQGIVQYRTLEIIYIHQALISFFPSYPHDSVKVVQVNETITKTGRPILSILLTRYQLLFILILELPRNLPIPGQQTEHQDEPSEQI